MTTAELSTIAIAILERPTFDNRNLGNSRQWTHDNIGQLARFWKQCGHALGLSEEDERELDVWIRCQHDIELGMQRRQRLSREISPV